MTRTEKLNEMKAKHCKRVADIRAEAHGKLQAATAKRLQAVEEEGEARFQWTSALRRIENREGYAKSISREIAQLKGEG
ncbi:MAG: hypothetical protein M3N18_07235 [Actinomycetota bacterium]|nr:hypothetical protein [Actinomycetota bacterium]